MEEPQITSCFPNDNKKRIDYVIFYKYSDQSVDSEDFKLKEINRNNFLDVVQKESIILNSELKFKTKNETHQYILLHCPLERLLKQAERIKLEMRLKDAKLDDPELINYEIKWIRAVKDFILRRKPIRKDDLGDIVSMPFELSMKDLFCGCDDKSLENTKGPYSSNTRSLLVHSILNDLNSFKIIKDSSPSQESVKDDKHDDIKSHKGLEYLIKENYFDDAFILHDDSRHFIHLVQLVDLVRQTQLNEKQINDELENELPVSEKKVSHDGDVRNELYLNWAKVTNIFKTQPLSQIRQYFGESVAFYFAWIGTFIWTLILPSVIGFAFFIAGIVISSQKLDKTSVRNLNSTGLKSASIYGDYYLNIFADSFDNDMTPYFALIICLWGAIFSEFWKRENNRLAYEWDVLKFENEEINLPDYERNKEKMVQKLKTASELSGFLYTWQRFFKILLSYTVLLFMVCIICIEIALVVLFRIYIRIKVFPNDDVLGVIIGDGGSTVINVIIIMIMNWIYTFIAVSFTKWENYRTKTEYDDALIIKLFIFEFVNSYGSLFYMAFFRTIEYENGLFNLGKEYQDKCDNDNCMALLSIQLLVVFIVKPLPPFFMHVILPLLQIAFRRCLWLYSSKNIGIVDNESLDRTEKKKQDQVLIYLQAEKNKARFDVTIDEEYTQKVILYGYIVLFACTFSLGPLFVLVINVVDLRIDGNRLLWIFRRPIGFRAQDIGAWFHIIRFLNIAGIVSNAFIIAFTSNWSKSVLNGTLENRLLFVVAFEHTVFVIWLLVIILFPDIPQSIAVKIRAEAKSVKKIVSNSKDMLCVKNGFSKSLPNNENEQSDLDILSNSNDLNQVSMQSKPDINDNKEALNDNLESLKEMNYIDEFKINEQTRKRKRKNKKYSRLASQIEPVV